MVEWFDIVKRAILPQLPYRFEAIPFKIPTDPFKETDNSTIYTELQRIEKNENKNRYKRLTLSNFNLQKLRQCWICKGIQIDQWKKTEFKNRSQILDWYFFLF